MIALLLYLLLTPAHAQQVQPAPPDWENKATTYAAPNTLIDADTHRPLVISDAERGVIVHAMEVMLQAEPERKSLALYQAGIDRIKSGSPLTMGDVMLLNGPLMMAQSATYQYSEANPQGMTDAEIALIKPLLRKIRKSAAAMASTAPPYTPVQK